MRQSFASGLRAALSSPALLPVTLAAMLLTLAAVFAWWLPRSSSPAASAVTVATTASTPGAAGTIEAGLDAAGPASNTARTATATPGAPGTPTASPTPLASAPASTPSGAPTSEATRPAVPPSATPTPPLAQVPATLRLPSGLSAGIGETFLLSVEMEGGATVIAEFDGTRYTLAGAPPRFWSLVGIPLTAAPGGRTLVVTARDAAGNAVGSAEALLLITPVGRPVDYLQVTEEQGSVLTPDAAATEAAQRAAQFSDFDTHQRLSGPIGWPVFGEQTTAFGQGRSINGGPVGGFHTGEDIACDFGQPIVAAGPGRVSWTGSMPIRGNSVVLDHGIGVKTGYHHLDTIVVADGALVAQGELVGYCGSTGFSTGPHLHWELTIWGVNVDPVQWTREAFLP